MLRLIPDFGDAAGSGVVTREREERAVLLVEISIAEILIEQLPHVFRAAVNVRLHPRDIA